MNDGVVVDGVRRLIETKGMSLVALTACRMKWTGDDGQRSRGRDPVQVTEDALHALLQGEIPVEGEDLTEDSVYAAFLKALELTLE